MKFQVWANELKLKTNITEKMSIGNNAVEDLSLRLCFGNVIKS